MWLSDKLEDHLPRHFRANIRTYNNALSFASLGVTVDPISRTAGVPVFKIQGQLSHRIGPLLPQDGLLPQFLQVYITDNSPAGQAFRRQAASRDFGTSEGLLAQLSQMMAQHNPFARLFLNAGERIRSLALTQTPVSLCLSTVQPLAKDPRRYNLPRSREVGAIVCNHSGPMVASHREIVLHARQGRNTLINIDDANPDYLPLRFVLLLPHGTSGWSMGMPMGVFHGYGQNIVDSDGKPYNLNLRGSMLSPSRGRNFHAPVACISPFHAPTSSPLHSSSGMCTVSGVGGRCLGDG